MLVLYCLSADFGDALLAAIFEILVADTGRVATVAIDQHELGYRKRCRGDNFPPSLACLAGPFKLGMEIDILDDSQGIFWQNADDLAGLTLVLARDDLDRIAFANLEFKHNK